MRVNKLYIHNNKQIFYYPSAEKVSSVIRRTLDITDTIPVAKDKTAMGEKHIPIWAQCIYVSNFSPKNILAKIIRDILNKPEISQRDEDLFRRAFDYALQDIRKPENILGDGFHETVYKIDNEFAAKLTPMNSSLKIWDANEHLVIPKNEYSDLKTYYGGILAKLGNIKILRNLGEHIPAGIPQKNNITKDYYVSEYLPLFAKVPQESYNSITEDCAKLNSRHDERGYYYNVFDYMNPNNIVLKDNNLFWVDRIRTRSKEPGTTTDILNLLLNKYDCMNNVEPDSFKNHYHEARIIFEKIIKSGMHSGLPIDNPNCFNIEIWDNILNNLGIKTNSRTVLAALQDINKINIEYERTQQTEFFLENLFAKNPI